MILHKLVAVVLATLFAISGSEAVSMLPNDSLPQLSVQGAGDKCQAEYVESVPQHMKLEPERPKISDAWIKLAREAKKEIKIASFYWTLTVGPAELGGDVGRQVYNELVSAARRGIKVKIVQSAPTDIMPDNDTIALAKEPNVEVSNLNVTDLFGAGVLHTKLWVVDGQHVYVGSANMDWRSLTQVKELGVLANGCPSIAADFEKSWETYYVAARHEKIPDHWPSNLEPSESMGRPATSKINGQVSRWFSTASPVQMCPSHRTVDIDSIVGLIGSAKKSVSIEVMDYMPVLLYGERPQYWPVIDDAIRSAAWNNGVHVRLLVGNWTYSNPASRPLLQSLAAVNDALILSGMPGRVEVGLFNVPADPAGTFQYTRVNHAKFMVTDEAAFVTTSNWSADYFENTAGVSLVMQHTKMVKRLQAVFDRDWDSKYTLQYS